MVFTRNAAGFTLLEVLVSITVLLTVTFLPFSIIAEYLINNELTRDKVKAQFRAQEIIDFVRHDRDSYLIDPDSTGNWFSRLETRDPFKTCTIPFSDWIDLEMARLDGSAPVAGFPYCTLNCLSKDSQGHFSSSTSACIRDSSFVWGVNTAVGAAGEGGSTAGTCDGKPAKANGEFTMTLQLVLPDSGSRISYAIINPCISWKRQGADFIEQVSLQETLFEWVIAR